MIKYAENTAPAAASPFWFAGTTTLLELSHFSNATEVQNADNQASWPPKPKNCNSSLVNSSSCCASVFSPGGTWSTSLANCSLDLLRASAEDHKNVDARSNLCDYNSPVSSRASNGLLLDQVQRGKRQENLSSCRLFGFDLRNNSKNLFPLEKGGTSAVMVQNDANNAAAPVYTSDGDFLKSCNEKKQVQSDASPKDAQHKPGCSTSTRTRTKV